MAGHNKWSKDRPPVLAVTALISSHAPWTPLPRFVDWDAVGDGSIFNGTHRDGDTPEVVWRDPDRIRDQFRKSIDYSLRSLAGFIEKRMASGQILMFLGDHQPAPLVAGSNSGHDVPLVIIGPPDVMAALDSWNWTPSATPAHDAPVWPMEAFRDRFLAAFTPDAPKPQ
jgi:hypothetical protein